MGSSLSRELETDHDDVYQYKPSAIRRGPEQLQKVQIHRKQVKNAFGGWNFQVNDIQRARRFLIMGCEGGTYTASEQLLKRENAKCFDRLISEGKGKELVKLIREISVEGRAARQGSVIFGLAVCARSNDQETKKAAYECLNEVCRVPTHLFMFVKYAEGESNGTGWGRAHRRAINKWYEELAEDEPNVLVLLITKYKKRENWSHRDLFRLSHIKPKNDCLKIIIKFVIKGLEAAKKLQEELGNHVNLQHVIEFLEATEKARKCADEKVLIQLIDEHSLVREHIPTSLLNSKEIWKVLLKKMPMTAMIRNLGKITSLGLLDNGSEYENAIAERLNQEETLKKARVHPFTVLVALVQYKMGKGDKGHLKWNPNEKVMTGLDSAYYLAFNAVEPTGKRYMLAIDISGSMSVPCIGTQSLTCRDAASAMMMVTFRTEEHCEVVAFSHELCPIPITKKDKLDEVIKKSSKIPFGGTDCALPMLYAMERQKKIDVFIVYTDNETWYGRVHPFKAIQDYRLRSEIYNAKLIVVGMSSNGFTIADPDDPNMLDIVGFDSRAIEIMKEFILENV
ncbi:hypothetical protein CHS0354_041329 [Potamilus streckersoni]|uniref:TROVE domain-containing protein n=1 Tax=Potamilus streckersoni TaxID=2493646 RepID=A0AAE0VU96_9BIVA|nr:hypothetical protein CHS0354_041329 [Potamilus streckersoni]